MVHVSTYIVWSCCCIRSLRALIYIRYLVYIHVGESVYRGYLQIKLLVQHPSYWIDVLGSFLLTKYMDCNCVVLMIYLYRIPRSSIYCSLNDYVESTLTFNLVGWREQYAYGYRHTSEDSESPDHEFSAGIETWPSRINFCTSVFPSNLRVSIFVSESSAIGSI